jgi:hypothetical protein
VERPPYFAFAFAAAVAVAVAFAFAVLVVIPEGDLLSSCNQPQTIDPFEEP